MNLASLVLAALVLTSECASHDDDASWKAAQSHFAQSLAKSPNPRDWILALKFSESLMSKSEVAAVLDRAISAAPDDVLVQSAAAVRGNDAATVALTRLEPDNGSSWLLALRSAIDRGDETAIDTALSGFSASTRFDDHYVQQVRVWQNAFRRQPDVLACDGVEHCDHAEKDLFFAVALARDDAFPTLGPRSWKSILTFCEATPVDSPRRKQCEMGARTMLEKGQTKASTWTGIALLLHLHALLPTDEENKRQQEWLMHVSWPIERELEPGAPGFAAYMADWTALDSEIEVLRRMAQHAGQPPLPPDGWISPGQHAREAANARGEP